MRELGKLQTLGCSDLGEAGISPNLPLHRHPLPNRRLRRLLRRRRPNHRLLRRRPLPSHPLLHPQVLLPVLLRRRRVGTGGQTVARHLGSLGQTSDTV